MPGYANTALTSCLWTLGIFGGIFIVIAGISIMMNVYKTDGLPITIMAGILGAYLSPIIVICYWVYHFIGYFLKWERHPYFGLFPLGFYSNNRWLDMGIEIFHDSRYYYDASYNLMTNFHGKNMPALPANIEYSIPKSFKGWEGGYPDLLKKANGILYGMIATPASANGTTNENATNPNNNAIDQNSVDTAASAIGTRNENANGTKNAIGQNSAAAAAATAANENAIGTKNAIDQTSAAAAANAAAYKKTNAAPTLFNNRPVPSPQNQQNQNAGDPT